MAKKKPAAAKKPAAPAAKKKAAKAAPAAAKKKPAAAAARKTTPAAKAPKPVSKRTATARATVVGAVKAPPGSTRERDEEFADAVAMATDEAARFTLTATVAYQKAAWESGREPPMVDCQLGALAAQVPKAWGTPSSGNGALTWELPDAMVRLFVSTRTAPVPTLGTWVAMRRQVLSDDWLIVGQKVIAHPTGALALETAEVCAVAPRLVRAVRALFATPSFATLALASPGPIPEARGKELAAAFRSLRVMQAAG